MACRPNGQLKENVNEVALGAVPSSVCMSTLGAGEMHQGGGVGTTAITEERISQHMRMCSYRFIFNTP